ncbi:MAG: SDR family oxidoreductase [Dehalococcoidia bacterium]
MDLGIKGKVALVTGGSRGLGRQSAIALAAEGVNVAICARGEDVLNQTAAELKATGVNVGAYVADLSDESGAAELAAKVEADLGPIEILVNNVGGSLGTSDLVNSSLEDFHMVMNANLWSAIALMKLVVPGMQQRGWGRVVNISSIFGREYGGTAPYMVAKAAMIAASKHTGMAVAKDGVTVNSVAPGSILHAGGTWEKFVANSTAEEVEEFIAQNLPMGKFGWPEPVAAAVAFLASQPADLITGVCLNVDGGQSHNLF